MATSKKQASTRSSSVTSGRTVVKTTKKRAGPAKASTIQPKASTAKKAARTSRAGTSADGRLSRIDPAVEAFMLELNHPLKASLEAVRQLILGVSTDIQEGIKWNSPSFRTGDWFATANVQGSGRPPRPAGPPSLCLILHTGAKVKTSAKTGLKIADPSGLLKWLAKDRCLVTLGDADDVAAKRDALAAILKQWIPNV